MDLNKLEALANAAGAQAWKLSKYGSVQDASGNFEIVPAEMATDDKAFIAASNPVAMLELIALVRRQEAELAEARASLPAEGAVLTDEQIERIAEVAWREGRLSWVGFKEDADGKYTIPVLSRCHFDLVNAVLAAQPAPSAAPIPAIVREALEATFEQRQGYLRKVAAAVCAIGDAPAQAAAPDAQTLASQGEPVGTFLRITDAFGETWLHQRGEPEPGAVELYAAAQPEAKAAPDLSCVIHWLEGGCDPIAAAQELRAYQKLMGQEPAPVIDVKAAPAAPAPSPTLHPACKGMNCGCTDGVSHSAECQAEHAAACAGGIFVKSTPAAPAASIDKVRGSTLQPLVLSVALPDADVKALDAFVVQRYVAGFEDGKQYAVGTNTVLNSLVKRAEAAEASLARLVEGVHKMARYDVVPEGVEGGGEAIQHPEGQYFDASDLLALLPAKAEPDAQQQAANKTNKINDLVEENDSQQATPRPAPAQPAPVNEEYLEAMGERAASTPAPAMDEALTDAYRAVQNCLLVVPDGPFKRAMDDWLTARLGLEVDTLPTQPVVPNPAMGEELPVLPEGLAPTSTTWDSEWYSETQMRTYGQQCRAAALEEAARYFEQEGMTVSDWQKKRIAAAIRALNK